MYLSEDLFPRWIITSGSPSPKGNDIALQGCLKLASTGWFLQKVGEKLHEAFYRQWAQRLNSDRDRVKVNIEPKRIAKAKNEPIANTCHSRRW
ncbi:hypothetical protein [Coleofasciculus sp. FACHB-1120]|uniref:hypothetical protein n=1 Tax=Coleofasciculus sp. FACHB-1120 TaxID=2692783 RepID=UPI001689381F|nr:hypothetical protein [Coleofasciculus sp. FACHB-1120]MBD2741933.1 hypothetical protein [Coleofasciculus sp. FACHB-1120]